MCSDKCSSIPSHFIIPMYHLTKQTVRAKLNLISPFSYTQQRKVREGEVMFRTWHHTPHPANAAICSLLHNISLREEAAEFFFSLSLSLNHSGTKKKSTFNGCQRMRSLSCLCQLYQPARLPVKHTHIQAQPHTLNRMGHEYFSSVYYIETPWHWGWRLHHGSPWPGWHTTLIFLSGGISEWRHETVHETLSHLSNVYFSTWAECEVTEQQWLIHQLWFDRSRVLFHTLKMQNATPDETELQWNRIKLVWRRVCVCVCLSVCVCEQEMKRGSDLNLRPEWLWNPKPLFICHSIYKLSTWSHNLCECVRVWEREGEGGGVRVCGRSAISQFSLWRCLW